MTDDDDATTDDGLPADPEQRRKAIEAQFDDYQRQLAALTEDRMAGERSAATDHPAAAWYRQDLERVEADLLAVVRTHMPRVGYQLIAHALIEVVGSVCGDIVDAQPTARVDLDTRLEQLRLHVATVGQPTQ